MPLNGTCVICKQTMPRCEYGAKRAATAVTVLNKHEQVQGIVSPGRAAGDLSVPGWFLTNITTQKKGLTYPRPRPTLCDAEGPGLE
jgi:hypothetical protein